MLFQIWQPKPLHSCEWVGPTSQLSWNSASCVHVHAEGGWDHRGEAASVLHRPDQLGSAEDIRRATFAAATVLHRGCLWGRQQQQPQQREEVQHLLLYEHGEWCHHGGNESYSRGCSHWEVCKSLVFILMTAFVRGGRCNCAQCPKYFWRRTS